MPISNSTDLYTAVVDGLCRTFPELGVRREIDPTKFRSCISSAMYYSLSEYSTTIESRGGGDAYASLDEELDEATERNDMLEADLRDEQVACSELQSLLDTALDEHAEAVQESSDLRDEIADKDEEIVTLCNQVTQLTRELENQ